MTAYLHGRMAIVHDSIRPEKWAENETKAVTE